MKQFDTLDELWMDAANSCLVEGTLLPSRAGDCYEILGYTARLLDPRANFMFNPIRKMSPNYAAAELIWYLSGKDTLEALEPYAPQYIKFCNEREDGSLYAHGAYGKRWQRSRQLVNLIELLRSKPETRQGILVNWESEDAGWAYSGDKNDLPCTLCLNFIVRNRFLYLLTTMRSNDIWLGTPYDIWSFTCLQSMIASFLGLGLGWYQHSVMSLHCYQRNEQKAREALCTGSFNTGPLEYQHDVGYVYEKWHRMVEYEKHNRENVAVAFESDGRLGGPGTLFNQVVLMAASKWQPERATDRVTNNLLKKYMEKFYANT